MVAVGVVGFCAPSGLFSRRHCPFPLVGYVPVEVPGTSGFHIVSHTVFIGFKRREFYHSHLPAYFSEVNKRAILSSPLVCSDALFAESDIARLLADTPTSSSLVDVASHGSGARRRHYSPHRSPTRSSPSRHRRRDSGSPSRQSKCVHFDLPAPSSALKGSLVDFCKVGSCPSSGRVGGCLAAHWEVWELWGADPWMVQVLHYGYWVLFCSRPPLSCVPLPLLCYTPTSIQGLALAAAVVDL